MRIASKIKILQNFQDLPEHFEDNITLWMGHFHTLLVAQEPCLETDVSL